MIFRRFLGKSPSSARGLALFGLLVWLCGCAANPVSKAAPASASTQVVAATPPSTATAPSPVALGQETAKVPVFAGDPQWGAGDAPVTIVEFGDFQCPYTGRVAPTISQLQRTYGPARLRVVWKHLPLPFHEAARPAHDASAAVNAIGGSPAFFKFAAELIAHQTELNPAQFPAWAANAGVDEERFRAALAQNTAAKDVDRDLALAASVGVNGTPGFLINGVSVSGAQPYERFREVIDQQLAEADKLTQAGVPRSKLYAQLTAQNYQAPVPPKDREEEAPDTTVWKIQIAADDPVRGPADALVTIVQWSDFQCPFCKRVEPTIAKLREQYPKELRVVWKDNPLPFHARAMPAAILARKAYEQKGNEAFWRVHDGLFESAPALEDDDFQRVAKAAGVRWEPQASKKQVNKIDDSIEQADDFGARGTPHFFINGVRLSGAQPFEKFQSLVEQELAKARALVANGTPAARVYAELLNTAADAPAPERKELPAPDANTPMQGNARAPVLIQEWSDFQCPFCKRVTPTLTDLEREFTGKIRLAWRHLPLPFHRYAELAAEAAQEVFRQKGSAAFFKYHDRLFAAQDEAGGLERPHLEQLAGELGLNMAQFRAALDQHTQAAKVEADKDLAEQAGINGTPAFVINGYFLSGAQPIAAFRRLVRRALRDAKASPVGTPQPAKPNSASDRKP